MRRLAAAGKTESRPGHGARFRRAPGAFREVGGLAIRPHPAMVRVEPPALVTFRNVMRLVGLALLAVGFVLLWRTWNRRNDGLDPVPAAASAPAANAPAPPAPALDDRSWARREAAELGRIAAFIARLESAEARRSNEAVLTFDSAAAYRRFLELAARSGLDLAGHIDALRAVRIRFQDADALQRDLFDLGLEIDDLAANFLMLLPEIPPVEERQAAGLLPLGNHLLEFLGVHGDNSQWGRGVTIAIVDTGIVADATFGPGRLRTLDIGMGSPGASANDGHGTAVAALAAGSAADAQGVSPAADLLSVRVTDADGLSDVFTVARAIVAAVEAGAEIINVSLGTWQNSPLLASAIGYADERGVVIVAAAGNGQSAQLEWPAADPRVISVGAVDALSQQVTFSNSGPQLRFAAPGYGVQTAWVDGSRVLMDGTSASAPVVAGSIAALVSQNPGMSAADAVETLQQHASEAGVAGADEDYGHGVVNLGWAMARSDFARIDTAVASHVFDGGAGTIEVVLQNRSARAVSGLTLLVEIGGGQLRFSINWLGPGATDTVAVPMSSPVAGIGREPATIRTRLVNPTGTVDAVPENNTRTSAWPVPPPAAGP